MNGKTRVLIIDDEKDLVDFLKTRLEANKYDVICAYNGLEGIEKARTEDPDLILLDIIMPGIDGFEVLSRLKNDEETCTIPVVMLTAKGEIRYIFEAQDLRAVDYIIKPINIKALLKLIRRYTV